MKRNLLVISMLLTCLIGYAQQVVFDILTPPEVAGFKDFTQATVNNGWTNMPDWLNLDNSVTGELVFVSDGTAADSLGCNELVNGFEVAGKIAVVWRGTCPFGWKAKNAWDQGAIAVIVLNNTLDPPLINMLADAEGNGAQVDVPVIATTYQLGLDITSHINNGDATAFIGYVEFPNNLTINLAAVLRSRYAVAPKAILPNASDLSIPIGTTISNIGIAMQSNILLNAIITHNGEELYNETVTLAEPLSPDFEAALVLPTFTPAEWDLGTYEITYTVSASEEDNYPDDNVYTTTVHVDPEIFSYSPWVTATQATLTDIYYQPSAWVDFFEACVYFRSPYAEDLKPKGISFRALAPAGQTLEGQIISTTAYEWLDNFEEVPEIPEVFNLNEIDFGVHEYTANDVGVNIFVPFNDQPQLVNNQHYLFCVRAEQNSVFFGSAGDDVNYLMTNENPFLPVTPFMNGAVNSPLGFGEDAVFSTMVHFDLLTSTDDKKPSVDITPFPNPTRDFVKIPYVGNASGANLLIHDLNGKMVRSQNVNFIGSNYFEADMNGLADGTYVFSLQFDNETKATFKVVVLR